MGAVVTTVYPCRSCGRVFPDPDQRHLHEDREPHPPVTLDSSLVSVVIPTIPPRKIELARALASVTAQKLLPAAVIVQEDRTGAGAMATRNTGLHRVNTPWVAFLDDDDELLPDHLRLCLTTVLHQGADMVYPWFYETRNRMHRRLNAFGRPFESLEHMLGYRNWIPVTTVVRTDLLRRVGGFQYPPKLDGLCEDWGAWRALHTAGAKIVHLPARTWVWHHHRGQTRGRPDRWQPVDDLQPTS